jgi:hypothetical protein
MDNLEDGVLDTSDGNDQLLIGILLGIVAGFVVAIVAKMDAGTQTRRKVSERVANIDRDAVQNRLPSAVTDRAAQGWEAVATRQARAMDLINRSPLPVNVGAGTDESPTSDGISSASGAPE